MDAPIELWRPKSPKSTRTWEFKALIERKHGVQLPDYEALHRWSTDNLDAFWSGVWYYTGVKASQPFTKAVSEGRTMFPRPAFFLCARLNFAENLLFPSSNPAPDSLAVISATETSRARLTWAELRERVRLLSNALRAAGAAKGDRVAGYVGNHAHTLVAMLAATALGCVWTSVAPDAGAHAALDRFQQVAPAVLFCDNAAYYNGKVHETRGKVAEIVAGLPKEELRVVVVLDAVPGQEFDLSGLPLAQTYEAFLACASAADVPQTFEQLPADHPVYILYSSGTTGRPKCIVHGAAGTLVEHKKEHEIQASMRPGELFMQFTTTGWMMWNWLVSGLASGLTLVLYDGSPFRPLDPTTNSGALAMPHLIEELQINHFGTSAKYLSLLEQENVEPRKHGISLQTLRTIFSTGSPLVPSTFDYVYAAFGPDLLLASITGGTDIASVFVGPSAMSPVHRGEIQARGLGFALEAWDPTGEPVPPSASAAGDLVCTRPFPCQPVFFWADGAEGPRYRAAYFEHFPGVWRHGDWVRFSPVTGGAVMLGRSDGVLKPAGVRFGSAEIYSILQANVPEVADALCVGRRRERDADETVVLFLKMKEGESCGEALVRRVKTVIAEGLSRRHVPGIVAECPEIPVTTNGKKVEVAVKQILCGIDVEISASVANAECLEWYRHWSRAHP